MSANLFDGKNSDCRIHVRMHKKLRRGPSIVGCVHRLFRATRIFGIYPRNFKSQFDTTWLVYSVVLFVTLSGNALYGLYRYKEVYAGSFPPKSLFLRLSQFHFFVMNYSGAVCILATLFMFDTYSAVFGKLGELDSALYQLGLAVKMNIFKAQFRFGLRFIVIAGFICSHVAVVTAHSGQVSNATIILNTVGFAIPLTIVGSMEYQHAEFMRTIKRGFQVIRKRVITMNTRGNTYCPIDHAELESLVKIYNSLKDASTDLDKFYGVQMLFVTGTIFVTFTSCANYVAQDIVHWTNSETIKSQTLLLANTYWGLFRLLELWSIISAYDSVVEQAKDFSAELYEMMINDYSQRLSKNKKLFLHISSQTEPLFTAYGFFTLDNSLLHSVISAATTYIVILLQLSVKPKPPDIATK